MANYYQTVPNSQNETPQQNQDDGCNWILNEDSNDHTQHNMATDDAIAQWNEIEQSLRNNIDDEIRCLRNRIHHLLDEKKMKCDFMLGISGTPTSKDDYIDDESHCSQPQQMVSTQSMLDHENISDISSFTCDFEDAAIDDDEKPPISSRSSMNYGGGDESITNEDDFHLLRIMKAVMSIRNHHNDLKSKS